jgi:hypothetical protein
LLAFNSSYGLPNESANRFSFLTANCNSLDLSNFPIFIYTNFAPFRFTFISAILPSFNTVN